MLAKINWTFFFRDDMWKTNIPALVASLKEILDYENETIVTSEDPDTDTGTKVYLDQNY